jgi:hypothetical protein
MRIQEIIAPNESPTMWRLSPFAALPKAVRYCEAETADEAAQILGARLAKIQWNRARDVQVVFIEMKRPPNGRLNSYSMTVTAANREGDHLEKTVDFVVRNSSDEFE